MSSKSRQGHIIKVLTVYNTRGKEALHCLESEKFDEVIEILKWRKGAFHNLVALIDGNSDLRELGKEFIPLWNEVSQVNVALANSLEASLQGLTGEIEKSVVARSKIAKFLSPVTMTEHVLRTV